jgi:hypothetical protein
MADLLRFIIMIALRGADLCGLVFAPRAAKIQASVVAHWHDCARSDCWAALIRDLVGAGTIAGCDTASLRPRDIGPAL